MVPTAGLAAVEEIATRCGAKVLLTGGTEQLSASGRRPLTRGRDRLKL